jgi:hypothetical protein
MLILDIWHIFNSFLGRRAQAEQILPEKNIEANFNSQANLS